MSMIDLRKVNLKALQKQKKISKLLKYSNSTIHVKIPMLKKIQTYIVQKNTEINIFYLP